jgi:hypothetical protein
MRYSLIEYGFVACCRVAHYLHSFQIFEHRYPNLQELYEYIQSASEDTSLSRIATELMQRDTEQYWEKKHSGLTEQDIYKYVQNNEEKDVMCCVCQEPIAENDLVVKLCCNHVFHRGAAYRLALEDRVEKSKDSDCQGVEEWLKKSGTCPICRSEVKVKEA